MNRIDRYLVGKFAFSLLWSVVAFWAIFLIVNLVENLDKFIDKGAPAKYVALYYVYYSPYILILVIPIAVLLATLFSVGFLSKRFELLAMRAAGLSLVRLSVPLLVSGLVVAAAVFIGGNTIYPEAERRRAALADQFIRGAPRTSPPVVHGLFATGLDGRVFYLRTFNKIKSQGTDVTVQTFADGAMTEVWEIRELRYEDSIWVGEDCRYRLFGRSGDTAGVYTTFDLRYFPEWDEVPEDLVRKRVDPRRTTYAELAATIRRMKSTGAETAKEETELELKLAYPLLSFLVVLIGFPIATRTKQSGMALNFGIAMGVTFALRVLIEVFRSLGHNGDVSPLVAAWAPNLICLVAGLYVLYRVRK